MIALIGLAPLFLSLLFTSLSLSFLLSLLFLSSLFFLLPFSFLSLLSALSSLLFPLSSLSLFSFLSFSLLYLSLFSFLSVFQSGSWWSEKVGNHPWKIKPPKVLPPGRNLHWCRTKATNCSRAHSCTAGQRHLQDLWCQPVCPHFLYFSVSLASLLEGGSIHFMRLSSVRVCWYSIDPVNYTWVGKIIQNKWSVSSAYVLSYLESEHIDSFLHYVVQVCPKSI